MGYGRAYLWNMAFIDVSSAALFAIAVWRSAQGSGRIQTE